MKSQRLVWFGGAIVLAAILSFLPYMVNHVRASIAVFAPSTCYNFAATTSLSYMSWGLATTTVTCNLGIEGAQVATAKVIVNASSTFSDFRFQVEESMDGVDWFRVTPLMAASTTPNLSLDIFGTLSYRFASSTIGGVAASTGLAGVDTTNNRNQFLFDIPVRMKQVRVVASIATSSNAAVSSAGALNLQIVPRQEIN